MNTDIYNKIIEDHKELTSLPQTLTEVLRILKDENSNASDLANVISRDPALTAKMLRIVNSPYYGAGREITTLSQAVMTLGTRAVSALTLSTSIYDMTDGWETSLERTRFWRHSLEVAVAARSIAEIIRYPRIEEAFITGILHDIGLLVLEKSFPDKFKSIWNLAESGDHLIELEENSWSTNHARVGQFLLEQWHIPSVITGAIGQHHNNFPLDEDDKDFLLPQIVALANKIAKFSTLTVCHDSAYDVEQKDIIRKNLKIPVEQMRELEKNLLNQVVNEAEFLEIEIGSSSEILMEANKMLYRQYMTVENLLSENAKMQQEVTQAKIEKVSLEAVNTITATFNHYINNAVATILGRAQLLELSLSKGDIVDKKDKMGTSLEIIISGVDTVQMVLQELRNLSNFKTIVYHDDTYILDIEKKIKKSLEQLKQEDKNLVAS